jgi:hypothetical protein
VFETFVVEGDKYVYLAQERLRRRWSKAANLTVNGPVKYAVEKRKLFVMDEDGKEPEMEIVKKTLRLHGTAGEVATGFSCFGERMIGCVGLSLPWQLVLPVVRSACRLPIRIG